MTTRRDVLAGMAGASLTTIPALAAPGLPDASAAVARSPAQPPFAWIDPTDRNIMKSIEDLEKFLAAMKRHLVAAQVADPVERYGFLYDFDCSRICFGLSSGFLDDQFVPHRLAARVKAKAAGSARRAST